MKEVGAPHRDQEIDLLASKITKHAAERNEALRADYRLKIGANYIPDQLVFVDESACDRRTYLRNRAWALEGRRACRKQYFARGKRYVTTLYLSQSLFYCSFPKLFDTAGHYTRWDDRVQNSGGLFQLCIILGFH